MSWHVVFSCFSLLGFRLSPKVTWVTLRCLPSLPELVRGLAFVLVCGCVSLAFFDEEPVLDFSDWSALHVALLVLSVFLALTETQVRSLFGQATELDDYVYLSAMYQWLRLVNYTRLLLVVLAYHYLTPLEAELFELVGVYLLTSSWVGVALIPQACIICVLAFISVLLTSSRFRLRGGFYVACLCVLVGLALVSALILAWDVVLLVASHADPVDPVNYYNRARAASNPHARLRNPDAADWHKPRVRPVSLRFEGLTQAYLALFLVVAWLEVLTVWAFTFLGVLANPGSLSSGRVAVAVLWLKNLLAALLLSWVYLGLASTRLLLATDPLTLLG